MKGWHAELHHRFADDFELDIVLTCESPILALVGPNGSGKSTVLKALAGALVPHHARISVGDRELSCSARKFHLATEDRNIGYLPQGYALFPHLSALDNVAFGLALPTRGLNRRLRRQRALTMLRQLGCGELATRSISQLSGGEQQRVALARALIVEPELLLLDEAMAALDVGTRRSVRRFLAERLQQFARPTVLVTHDVRDIIAFNAEVCVLEAGRILQRGSLAQVREAPASEFVAEFVGLCAPSFIKPCAEGILARPATAEAAAAAQNMGDERT